MYSSFSEHLDILEVNNEQDTVSSHEVCDALGKADRLIVNFIRLVLR